MATNQIPIKDIIKSLFNISINNKEKKVNILNNNFNSTKAIEELKDKEIGVLISHENIMSNFSKAQRLLEVYSGSIDKEYRKKYISNIKWYKNFKNFRQDYLYQFSVIDNLRNEYILRALVTDKKFLDNYNIILKKKGLKVVIVNNKKLEDPKYKKYINNLMPFITTNEDEKNKETHEDNVEIKVQGSIVNLDDSSIEEIFKGTADLEKLLKPLEEKKKAKETIETTVNKTAKEKSKDNKNNKYNFLINMYDLKDIFLFGVINEKLPKNPSRREIDRNKKILNRTNLMKLINNSLVVNFKGESNLELQENKLVINKKKPATLSLYLDESTNDNSLNDKISLEEQMIKSGNAFTNLLYNLNLKEDVVITTKTKKEMIVEKNIYYFVLNNLHKSKFSFKSQADINEIFNFIKLKTSNNEKDKELLEFNEIFKNINNFFNNNRDIFRISTIDFIIAYIHSFYASFVSVLKLNLLKDKTNNNQLEIDTWNDYFLLKTKELKEILKTKEYNEFIKIIQLFSEFQKNNQKDDQENELTNEENTVIPKLHFYIPKNKKNKNSFMKQKMVDFNELFIELEIINEIFFPLFKEYIEFYTEDRLDYSLYSYLTYINKIKDKDTPNYIEDYLYNFFISFIVENYLVYPTEKNEKKRLDYKIENNLIPFDDETVKRKVKKENSFRNYVGFKLKEMADYLNKLNNIKKELNEKEYKLLQTKKELEDKEPIIFLPKKELLDFSYSIFNLKNYIELSQYNFTKEINNILKKIPNISYSEMKKATLKYLKDNKIIDEENDVQPKWLEQNLKNSLAECSLFEIKLYKKIKNSKDIKVETFYFKNIYEIFTFIYLESLIFLKDLEPLLGEGLNYFVPAKDTIEFEILFHNENDLRKVLNVIEFVKYILSHYKLEKKQDTIFSYEKNLNDEKINSILGEDRVAVKQNTSQAINKARDKFMQYANNDLSPFKFNLIAEETKAGNTERYEFEVNNLLIINSKNLEKLRNLFRITQLEFDNSGNTIIGMELSNDLIFNREDRKEFDKNKLEYLIIDNKLDFFKYPNINSKEYKAILEQKNKFPNDYLIVTEFIKANKAIFNLEYFIKLNTVDS